MSGDDTVIPEALPALGGDRVHRVHWVLGTDRLRAVCHCGAERVFEDPVALWEWLLAHPVGHGGRPGPTPPSGDRREPVLSSSRAGGNDR